MIRSVAERASTGLRSVAGVNCAPRSPEVRTADPTRPDWEGQARLEDDCQARSRCCRSSSPHCVATRHPVQQGRSWQRPPLGSPHRPGRQVAVEGLQTGTGEREGNEHPCTQCGNTGSGQAECFCRDPWWTPEDLYAVQTGGYIMERHPRHRLGKTLNTPATVCVRTIVPPDCNARDFCCAQMRLEGRCVLKAANRSSRSVKRVSEPARGVTRSATSTFSRSASGGDTTPDCAMVSPMRKPDNVSPRFSAASLSTK